MTSIIIPVYNTAPYLRQCLDSLLTQTITDWEAIMVDDASQDESAAVAEEYVLKDRRFTLLKQETHKGQSAARNRGLKVAKGEYLAFLDADDWWDNDYLERHLDAIEGYEMVQSGYRRISPDLIARAEKVPWHKWQFTSACMRLYRREAVEELRFEEGTYYEDVLWTVDVLLRKPKVNMLDYIGYNYRLNPQSTTSKVHEEDRKRVLSVLKKKKKSGITYYTILKLILYWKLGK